MFQWLAMNTCNVRVVGSIPIFSTKQKSMKLEANKSINKSYWVNMNEEELNEFAKEIFDFYRERGFPYYPTNNKIRDKDFQKLNSFNREHLFEDGVIKQTMHGLGLAWSYFPHAFNVKSNNRLTPYEAFMNDEIFLKVILKRLKMGTYISDSGIRKMLKIYSGVQGVSNFRPTAAATIYDHYADNGIVWDMSGGWGGRLLGAIISNVKKYIATEPSVKTFNGLKCIGNDFGEGLEYDILNIGSENYKPTPNSLDLCFTSPPYFNLEQYSNEPTQSYIKYNNVNKWLDGFLYETFKNCFIGLKEGKYMLINIANKKGGIDIEEQTIRIAKSIGFIHETTLKLALSNVNLRKKDDKFKYEPIFVFKKT